MEELTVESITKRPSRWQRLGRKVMNFFETVGPQLAADSPIYAAHLALQREEFIDSKVTAFAELLDGEGLIGTMLNQADPKVIEPYERSVRRMS